jgi:hypothetical protein
MLRRFQLASDERPLVSRDVTRSGYGSNSDDSRGAQAYAELSVEELQDETCISKSESKMFVAASTLACVFFLGLGLVRVRRPQQTKKKSDPHAFRR